MDFTFDLSQTPVIGRRFLTKTEDNNSSKTVLSPRRSCSLSPADTASMSGWKRPWMSQVKHSCRLIFYLFNFCVLFIY